MHVAMGLTTLSLIWLAWALISAMAILGHIIARKPPIMSVMKWVWPITALCLGPAAIWAHRRMELAPRDRKRPFWQYVFKGVTHCGGGCALGDIVGEWLAFWLGRTFAGTAPWPELMIAFALAFALGIVFQSFAIAPTRHLGPRRRDRRVVGSIRPCEPGMLHLFRMSRQRPRR